MLALGAIVLIGGCSDDSPTTTIVDGREVFVIEAFECDDQAACSMSVRIGGRLYGVACGEPPASESLRGELYAVGDSSLLAEEARVIRGVDPSVRVALHGRGCRESDGWFLGRASSPAGD